MANGSAAAAPAARPRVAPGETGISGSWSVGRGGGLESDQGVVPLPLPLVVGEVPVRCDGRAGPSAEPLAAAAPEGEAGLSAQLPAMVAVPEGEVGLSSKLPAAMGADALEGEVVLSAQPPPAVAPPRGEVGLSAELPAAPRGEACCCSACAMAALDSSARLRMAAAS